MVTNTGLGHINGAADICFTLRLVGLLPVTVSWPSLPHRVAVKIKQCNTISVSVREIMLLLEIQKNTDLHCILDQDLLSNGCPTQVPSSGSYFTCNFYGDLKQLAHPYVAHPHGSASPSTG